MNKRIFSIGILALSLGMTGMANPNPNNGRPNMPKRNFQRQAMTPEMQKQRIAIEEKQLAIKKEMIKAELDTNRKAQQRNCTGACISKD